MSQTGPVEEVSPPVKESLEGVLKLNLRWIGVVPRDVLSDRLAIDPAPWLLEPPSDSFGVGEKVIGKRDRCLHTESITDSMSAALVDCDSVTHLTTCSSNSRPTE